MAPRLCVVVGVLGSFLLASVAAAQGPAIDHAGVACIVAERFPQLEVRISSDPDAVARVHVHFRGESGPAWYFVEMKRSGAVFTGVLPKPRKSLKKMSYYIEASDRQFQETRTQEFTPAVVPQPGMCADPKMLAGALSAASVIVGGPPGAAVVPLGFSGASVTSASAAGTAGVAAGAGGGVGVGTIAVVGAGVAAAGAAVVVSQGGDSAPTTMRAGPSAPTTTTTLPAGPVCPGCYAGTWQAIATITTISPALPCGEPESPIGQPTTVAPITFSPDGTIVLPQQDCAGCAGRVDAQGNFTINTPGEGTCPSGQITGRCTSTSSCPGTGAQGGVTYTFVISRVGP